MTVSQRLPHAPTGQVPVKAAIIQEACRKDSGHCMIADAIRERYPGAKFISVDIQTIRFSEPKKGLRYTYLTPHSCQKAIIDFDQGIDPQPFSFRLRSGHVTRAGQRMYDSQTKRKQGKRLKRARIVNRKKGNSNLERVGGRTPPRFSMRREFGIKAYTR